jgi:hypothetical protein
MIISSRHSTCGAQDPGDQHDTSEVLSLIGLQDILGLVDLIRPCSDSAADFE